MRPVFLVFQGETFYTMIKEDIKLDDLSENVSLPSILQRIKPVYVEPLSSEDAIQRMDTITHGGMVEGEMYQVANYKPLSMKMDNAYMQDILNHATSYTVLLKSKTWKKKVEQFLKSHGGRGEDYLFYSIENPGKFTGIIIFNKKDFSFAGLVD